MQVTGALDGTIWRCGHCNYTISQPGLVYSNISGYRCLYMLCSVCSYKFTGTVILNPNEYRFIGRNLTWIIWLWNGLMHCNTHHIEISERIDWLICMFRFWIWGHQLIGLTVWLLYNKICTHFCCWTHWGRVTHICVDKLTMIGSDNCLSPGRRQAIIWTNYGILLITHIGTNFNAILTKIRTFSFNKIHLKMSSGKWRPFCLGLNVLYCPWWFYGIHLPMCLRIASLHV